MDSAWTAGHDPAVHALSVVHALAVAQDLPTLAHGARSRSWRYPGHQRLFRGHLRAPAHAGAQGSESHKRRSARPTIPAFAGTRHGSTDPTDFAATTSPARRHAPVLQPRIRAIPSAARHLPGHPALSTVETTSGSPPVGCDFRDFSVTFHAKPSHFVTELPPRPTSPAETGPLQRVRIIPAKPPPRRRPGSSWVKHHDDVPSPSHLAPTSAGEAGQILQRSRGRRRPVGKAAMKATPLPAVMPGPSRRPPRRKLAGCRSSGTADAGTRGYRR
jgi:hypothetical protein